MSKGVKVPVVERKKINGIRYTKLLFLASILILLFGLFIDNTLIILCSGLIIISTIVVLSFTKTHSISGFIILHDSHIKLVLAGRKEIYNLNDLDNVKIKYDGYDGEAYPNPKSIIPKDGTGNYIHFTYNDETFSYELLFERRNLNLLNNIISQWKKNKTNVTLIGEWGIKIKSL